MLDQFPSFPVGFGASFAPSFPVTGIGGFDPDAAAYIAAVESDGVTVTPAQKDAINAWYVTGKSDGWYSLVMRHYLPIWGQASPNARCMISGTSGTFAGTVTHGAGYVQGDGATGFFDPGSDAVSLGLSLAGASLFRLYVSSPAAASLSGYRGGGAERLIAEQNGSINTRWNIGSTVAGETTTGNRAPGILMSSRTSSSNLACYSRMAGGFSVVGTDTTTETQSILALNPYMFGAWNSNGSPQFLGAQPQEGPAGVGLGFTQQQSDDFTLAMKNLWEACTGLSL